MLLQILKRQRIHGSLERQELVFFGVFTMEVCGKQDDSRCFGFCMDPNLQCLDVCFVGYERASVRSAAEKKLAYLQSELHLLGGYRKEVVRNFCHNLQELAKPLLTQYS